MGDNGVYELGVLELRLADVDLNLRLSSEITIAPSSESSESDRDGTHTLATTGNIVHGDGVRKPWMVKSHGYQLKVDLALAPELKFEDETFTQQVAAKLKHLEIWQSLEFEVTSIEVCSSENAAASWTLSLDYREHSTPPKTKLHTLAPDVPYHDVKPPPGIHVIKVEGIRVELLLSRPLASGSRQCDSVKSTNVDRKGEDMCLDHELLFNTTDLIHERELSFITKAELGANSSKSPLLSLEEEATMHAVDDISAYLTPPPSQETKEQNHEESGMDSDQHQTSHVSAESVLSCIEAGLRHTMRKLPSRMSRTDVITSKEDFDSLASIAPALWTPGYHKSVSERAVFLPTISHAIANVSRNSSASLGLSIKAWQLSNRHPHHRGGRSSAESSDRGHGVEEALSMSLWTAMSSALTDGRTAKQSRLFCGSIKADGETNVFGDTEDMLDDLAKNSRSSEISDDSEFQDLLDMGGEADNESMSDWSVDDDGNLDGPCCTEASEHRLPNRWNTELQSLLDPELDMFNYGPELRGKFRTGVVETEDGDGGCTGGCHDTGQCFNGSDLDHDSAALQFLETEGQGLNAEDMLLHCVEGIGADTISGRAELDVCAATGDESGVEEQEYVDSVDGAELADDEWYEDELLDLM